MGKGAWRHTEREVYQTLKELKYGSCKEIAAKLGLSHKWVEDKLRVLKAAKRIYIADYKKTGRFGDLCRIYGIRLGDEEDVEKPKPLTAVEKTQNYRKRKYQRRFQDALTSKSSSITVPATGRESSSDLS